MSNSTLDQSLALPCGATLKNRFAKSAMSEALGTTDNRATEGLATLYKCWADGGTGLLISGNVMIDRHHLGEPNNVVLEDESDIESIRRWANAGTQNGAHLWMQLNHPGKQTPKMLTKSSVAPSAIPFKKELRGYFNTPRELTESEILDIIQRFGRSAALAQKAGFTGVQIHGAHGYLVSQFLSPHHNQRTDQWGGSLENRMRFVIEVYSEIRRQVGAEFPVSIKLNSADFQRGGFTEEESMQVAEKLASLGLDLLEISGGTYESPQMTGLDVRESTRQREAYFLDYAQKIRQRVSVPLMVTGGFRTDDGMRNALSSGATDLIGLGRPLALEPAMPNQILTGQKVESKVRPIRTGIKLVDNAAMMETMYYSYQIARMAKGKRPKPNENSLISLVRALIIVTFRTSKTKRLRA
ncbi:MAG: NADH:flavin oxidoreductase/NADH oxidase family protein [Alcanivoracaceae bacterium]|nr:NADH:flavin oxidoreductase/NADH oxidase family protein [Alcanivoracaceae bacterium]